MASPQPSVPTAEDQDPWLELDGIPFWGAAAADETGLMAGPLGGEFVKQFYQI